MRDLIILGTDPHSRDAVAFVDCINRIQPTWNVLGFVTQDAAEIGTTIEQLPVSDPAGTLKRYPDAALLPSFGWPAVAREIEARFVSVIDPSTVISRSARIGRGSLVYPHCFIGADARIGDRNLILSGCAVNHDSQLADRVILCSGVQVAGYVTVEPDCELGQSCSIRQRIRIGRNSHIGMGTVVIKDVPPDSVMIGNPARRLRARQPISPPSVP